MKERSALTGRERAHLAGTGVLIDFLKRARRRTLTNVLFDAAAVALSVGAAGAVLLLFLGTQILDWYWPVGLSLAAGALAWYRLRQRLPNDYKLAQTVDSRLQLRDTLATSFYFREIASEAPTAVETVERQAEAQLRHADAKVAVPFAWPRSATAAIALTTLCLTVLGIRYGLTHTLDLRAPMAEMKFGAFTETPANVQAATRKSAIQEQFEEQLKQLGLNVEDLETPESRAEKAQQESMSALPSPDGSTAPGDKVQSSTEKGSPGDTESSEPGEKSNGDNAEPGAESENAGAGQPKDAKAQQQPPAGAKPANKGAQENASLMDKMRDAMANLMDKMKTAGQQHEQQGSQQQANSPAGNQQQQQAQKGTQAQGRSQGEGQPSPDPQGERSGEGEQMPGAQTKSADKSASDKPGNQDAKSGMGKSDGDKEIKEAEQLAAMGKISEIFGKRAQQVTGEITVEVPSGKQSLKTAYSNQKASHADTGAEVNRDEIPLAYQPYVQRYFEEVRKAAAKKDQSRAIAR